MSKYEIREFSTIEELRDCVELQEETWGHGFSERVSPAILKVSQILGGVAGGAYAADGSLVGFVFGMTGVRDGRIVHWSDMLAVRRGLRDTGLGRELKAYQRRVLLERGIDTMYWTFDPLQSRNAYLNFFRLGIVAREYERDMYGQTDSPLHRGVGTDRLIALWRMDTERVRARVDRGETVDLSGVSAAPAALDAEEGAHVHPRPGAPRLDLTDAAARIAIPADISVVMADDMPLAVAWREATRAAFTHYLGRGWEVRELVRGDRVSHYLVEAPASTEGTE